MKTFRGKTFFKVGDINFRVSREQPNTSSDYHTSMFKLYKIKEGVGIFIAHIGFEKSYHPNGIVSADYKGTLVFESLEQDKLITEDEALKIAIEYVEILLS